MTRIVVGAAIGSVLGTPTYHRGGWPATAGIGAVIGLLLLALLAIEQQAKAGSSPSGVAKS